jgi:hypothetical protein
MNALERGEIVELSLRLFGEDGQGGALGRIEAKLDIQDGRISSLERDRIAREAAVAVGQRLDEKERDKQTAIAEGRRWRTTTIVATLGVVASLGLGILNLVVR